MVRESIRIILAISLAVSIGAVSLIILNFIGHDVMLQNVEKEFFSRSFEDNTSIFLLGSSQVGNLNTTFINSIISKEYPHYTVFNLADAAKRPVNLFRILDDMISTNPAMVVYGISYRDFQIPYENNAFLPEPQDLIDENIIFDFGFDINPKLITLRLARDFGGQNVSNNNDMYDQFTLFDTCKKVCNPIKSDDELKYEIRVVKNWEGNSNQINNIEALNQIIDKLQENNIKVVIFTTPMHQYFINDLSDFQKKEFEQILENLEQDFDVTVYDYTDRYVEKKIWNTLSHVAMHKDAAIFSKDVAQFMLQEIED